MCAIHIYMTQLAATEDRRHECKHASLMWYAVARCVCCPVPADLPGGRPAKALWRLHEAIEVMADTYCGSLALEYTHLQQQDEIAWMQQRFEGKQPLTGTQKRQVSTGLHIRSHQNHPYSVCRSCVTYVHSQATEALLPVTAVCAWTAAALPWAGAIRSGNQPVGPSGS